MDEFPRLDPVLAEERERTREAEAGIRDEIERRRARPAAEIDPVLVEQREQARAQEAEMSGTTLRQAPPDMRRRPARAAARPASANTASVPDGTVDEVLKWANTPERAKAAMEAESARDGGPRSSLMAKLSSRAG